jgi:hypothetical protein
VSTQPKRHATPFRLLTPAEQVESIRRMAASGLGINTIATVTGLAVEQIRKVIQPHACPSCED